MNNLETLELLKIIDSIDGAFMDLAIDESSAQYEWIEKLTELIGPNLSKEFDMSKEPDSMAEDIEESYPISYDRAYRIAAYLKTNYTVINSSKID